MNTGKVCNKLRLNKKCIGYFLTHFCVSDSGNCNMQKPFHKGKFAF